MSNPRLQNFTKAQLEEYVFPGTDAASVFVADGNPLPSLVNEVLKRSSQQRWYPVAGGHEAKIPFHYVIGHEELFRREQKGWNHEHCDFCDSTIAMGELCWTAPSKNGVYVFCKSCYDRVPTKRSWWKIWLR